MKIKKDMIFIIYSIVTILYVTSSDSSIRQIRLIKSTLIGFWIWFLAIYYIITLVSPGFSRITNYLNNSLIKSFNREKDRKFIGIIFVVLLFLLGATSVIDGIFGLDLIFDNTFIF